MKRYFFKIYLLLLSLAIVSCTAEHGGSGATGFQKIEIDVTNAKEYNVSEIYGATEYIPLFTDTANLMGSVGKIVRVLDVFYICSDKSIFIYNKDGSFKNVLQKFGEAEGEYSSITDFAVDEKMNHIEILDRRGRKIITYDLSGKYVSEWKLDVNANSFKKMSTDVYAFQCSTFQTDKKFLYDLIVKSKSSNKVLLSKFKMNTERSKYLNFIDYNNFCALENQTIFSTSGNNTIYAINGDGVFPKYLLGFGKNNMPESFLNRPFSDVRDFITNWSKTSYAGIFNAFIYEDEKVLISIPTTRAFQNGVLEKVLLIWDKKKQTYKLVSSLKDDLLFVGESEIIGGEDRPLGFGDGEIYSVVESEEIVEKIEEMKASMTHDAWLGLLAQRPVLKKLSKAITLESNPVLRVGIIK